MEQEKDNSRQNVTPDYSFEKSTYVKFLDRNDFKLAKYNTISLDGFSCFCSKPIEDGEELRVEINLKMISGGLIDDIIPHIAMAKFLGAETLEGKSVYKFSFVDFSENCFDNLTKAIDYLDKKEKLVSLPDISDGSSETRQTIEEVVEFIADGIQTKKITLPVLPTIVKEVEKVVKNPYSTSEDVAKVIETDAVISAQILSISNSLFYRAATYIVTIKEAIPRLGLKEVQNLVFTISNKSIYNTKNTQFKALLEKLWLHSLATASIAKDLAFELDLPESSMFFTLGIVHDIGQTILLRVIGEMVSDKNSFDTDEIIKSTVAHAHDLTLITLKHWDFPESFIELIARQRDDNFDKNTDKDILVLHIAEQLADASGLGLVESQGSVEELDALELIDVSQEVIIKICDETKTKITESSSAFN